MLIKHIDGFGGRNLSKKRECAPTLFSKDCEGPWVTMVIALKCSITVLSNGAMVVLKRVLWHNLNDSLPLLVRNLNTLFDRSVKLNLPFVEEQSLRNPQFLVQ